MRARAAEVFREALLTVNSLCCFVAAEEHLFSVHKAEGVSMEPTLSSQSALFIDRVAFRFKGIGKGDIVVAVQPVDPSLSVCKRVVATEGEFWRGSVIPPGHVYLEGDNPNNSFDSRHYGPVPTWLVKGKVVHVLL